MATDGSRPRHRPRASLRASTAGYVYVEYLVITVFVTLVCAFAFMRLGPPVMANYGEQTRLLRDEEP